MHAYIRRLDVGLVDYLHDLVMKGIGIVIRATMMILTIVCMRRLDDGLVDYLDEIVDKARTAETGATGAKEVVAKESQLVKMLTVIKDRVVAEIRTRDKPHVRMLAALLRMDDPPQ